MDPSIATSERGIWAVKWSFVEQLFITALLQVVVVISGSVALLSDTIHNFGDAATAVPLWIAFALDRLGTSLSREDGRLDQPCRLAWGSRGLARLPARRPRSGPSHHGRHPGDRLAVREDRLRSPS